GRSVQIGVREGNRWIFRPLPPDQHGDRRHFDTAIARLRRRRGRHLSLCPAGLDRRGEGRLGPHSEMAARRAPSALQFCRDHVPAGRASAEIVVIPDYCAAGIVTVFTSVTPSPFWDWTAVSGP